MLFARLLTMARMDQHVKTGDDIQARVHQGQGGTYILVTNVTADARPVRIALAPGPGTFTAAEDVWAQQMVTVDRHQTLKCWAKDAAVIALP